MYSKQLATGAAPFPLVQLMWRWSIPVSFVEEVEQQLNGISSGTAEAVGQVKLAVENQQ